MLNKFPDIYPEYVRIYLNNDNTYWENLALEINDFCEHEKVEFINYFYHDKLVVEKKNK